MIESSCTTQVRTTTSITEIKIVEQEFTLEFQGAFRCDNRFICDMNKSIKGSTTKETSFFLSFFFSFPTMVDSKGDFYESYKTVRSYDRI